MKRNYNKKTGMSYDDSYDLGYFEGLLIGRMISLVSIINHIEKDKEKGSSTSYPKILRIMGISLDFYNEIKAVIQKYPHYSEDHLVKKILFETSHRLF